MKKLEKLNAPTNEKNKDDLARERIDQVSSVVYGYVVNHNKWVCFYKKP